MKVRVDLALDFEGQHTLAWEATDVSGALDVPRAMLERWLAEREAFKVASLRWKRVIEEVEEQLYRAERDRVHGTEPKEVSKSSAIAAQLEQVVVVGAGRSKRTKRI